tara:strand:+ start:1073 stop:1258 length:186 start_codon:yes stop_codon:yes gene_type:complete
MNEEFLSKLFYKEFAEYANLDLPTYSKLLLHAGVVDALADKDMERCKVLVDEFKGGADYEA